MLSIFNITDVAPNLLEQEFNIDEPMSLLVSYLTYLRVGKHKDATLVQHGFANVKYPLETVKIYHDRGSQFKNVGIDELLSEYNTQYAWIFKFSNLPK